MTEFSDPILVLEGEEINTMRQHGNLMNIYSFLISLGFIATIDSKTSE